MNRATSVCMEKMKMFIKLTLKKAREPVWLNTTVVVKMEQSSGGTRITTTLVTGEGFGGKLKTEILLVCETPEEIMALIAQQA